MTAEHRPPAVHQAVFTVMGIVFAVVAACATLLVVFYSPVLGCPVGDDRSAGAPDGVAYVIGNVVMAVAAWTATISCFGISAGRRAIRRRTWVLTLGAAALLTPAYFGLALALQPPEAAPLQDRCRPFQMS